MKKLHIKVTKRLPCGRQLVIEMVAKVTSQAGNDKEVAGMLLEAEMHGNDGQARIHISNA